MLARSKDHKEYHDYDNPTLEGSMYPGEEGPRMVSSHESLDAGAVRPAMINILPGEGMEAAPRSPEFDTEFELPPGDDIEKPGKLKGLFGKKKDKKEKKEKKDKKDKKKDKKTKDQASIEVEPGEMELEPEPDVMEHSPPQETVPQAKGPSFGSKIKGLFSRKGAEKGSSGQDLEPVVTTPSSEGLEAANPAFEPSATTSPVDSPIGVSKDFPEVQVQTTPSRPLSSLLRKPRPTTMYDDDDQEPLAPLKPIPTSHPVRCSNVLNVVLLLGIVLGIIFLIVNAIKPNPTLAVVGPCFLGLSCFALAGKIFITLFWQEDPLPRFTPYLHQFEDSMYNRKALQSNQTANQKVIARSSHYGRTYDVNYGQEPLETGIVAQEPRRFDFGRYDEQIDTTPRQPEISKDPTFI